MTDLTGLLHAMASTRVLIVGDVALDSYIEGDANHRRLTYSARNASSTFPARPTRPP